VFLKASSHGWLAAATGMS